MGLLALVNNLNYSRRRKLNKSGTGVTKRQFTGVGIVMACTREKAFKPPQVI